MAYTDDITDALERGDLAGAAALLENAAPAHGDEADFAIAKATILTVAGDIQTAKAVLRVAARAHPGDGDIRYSLGSICYMEGRFGEAYRHYQNARARTGDPEVLAALDEVLAELAAKPGFMPPVLHVLRQEDLDTMDFTRTCESSFGFGCLMRRVEFGVDARRSIEELERGLEQNIITRQQVLDYIDKYEADRERLHGLLDKRLRL